MIRNAFFFRRRPIHREMDERQGVSAAIVEGEAAPSEWETNTVDGEETAPATAAAPQETWWRHRSFRRRRWFGPGRLKRYVTTVSVEDDVVRVVVFAGREVIAWGVSHALAHASLSPGEYADRLRAFIARVHPGVGGVVTDLPLYAPLVRRLSLPPIKKQDHLRGVVLSETSEHIPFSLDEVDVKWRHRARQALGPEVHVTAVPKGLVDRRVRLLKDAGFSPRAAYGQAAALAHASGLNDGVVVRLESTRAVVVLVKDRLPEVVHQVVLPTGDGAVLFERADAVAQTVEHVASYGEEQVHGQRGSPLPVAFTGMGARDALMAWALSESVQRETVPVAPPVVYPPHFSPQEYALNIGLALADRARGARERRGEGPWRGSLNLLSERHLPRPFPVRQAAVFVSLVLFASAAFNVTPAVAAWEARADALARQADSLAQRQRRTELEAAQAERAQARLDEALAMVAVLEDHLANLSDHMVTLRARVRAISRDAAPPGITVNNMGLQPSGFAITGVGTSYANVLDYTRALRATGLFKDVQVLQASADGDPVEPRVAFQARASLPEAEDTTQDQDGGEAGTIPVGDLRELLTLLQGMVEEESE